MLDGKVLYYYEKYGSPLSILRKGAALKECTVAERGISFVPWQDFLQCNTIPARNY